MQPISINTSYSWEQLNKCGLELLDQTTHDEDNKLTEAEEDAVCDYIGTKGLILNKLNMIISENTQMYGCTFTFKRSFHNDDPVYLHRMTEKEINKSRIWKDKKYILFAEFSPKGGILHYHGIIYGCYQTEFLRLCNWWRRKFGFVKPELEIRHPDKWRDYITKDYGKTGLWTLYDWD